jgi:hypothetical protein
MNRQKTKKMTRSQADVMAQELKELSEKMKSTAWRIHYYGGMAAEPQMRARELSGAADMVYAWACDVERGAQQ